MFKNLKEWKTTLFGLITIVLFGLVSFNVINAEQSTAINDAIKQIVDASGGDTIAFLTIAFGAVGGVLHLFVKDPKKEVDKE